MKRELNKGIRKLKSFSFKEYRKKYRKGCSPAMYEVREEEGYMIIWPEGFRQLKELTIRFDEEGNMIIMTSYAEACLIVNGEETEARMVTIKPTNLRSPKKQRQNQTYVTE